MERVTMVRCNSRFSIDQRFKELAASTMGRFPRRAEFNDPLLANLSKLPLSQLIDRGLDRESEPSGPVQLLSRVFRRFRRA